MLAQHTSKQQWQAVLERLGLYKRGCAPAQSIQCYVVVHSFTASLVQRLAQASDGLTMCPVLPPKQLTM